MDEREELSSTVGVGREPDVARGVGQFAHLDVVVMALDDGQLLHPLAATLPPALLRVANQPLIYYTMHQLALAGCHYATVVVSQRWAHEFTKTLQALSDVLEIQTRVETVDDGIGSADALRRISRRITKDFLLLSANLVSDFSLLSLVDMHYVHGSSACTLLLCNSSDKSNSEDIDRHYVGLCASDQRLIYLRSAVDLESESEFRLSKALVRRFGSLQIFTEIASTRAVIFARWVLELLDAKKAISTVHGELIPYLVHKQFADHRSFQNLITSDDSSVARSMSNSFVGVKNESGLLRCSALVCSPDTFCQRINTLPSFLQTNRRLLRKLLDGSGCIFGALATSNCANDVRKASTKVQLHGCMVGSGVTIASKSVLRSSVIGVGCTIGQKVSITNSVLMDNVVVEDGSVLENTVLCSQVHVGSDVTLHDCTVGGSFHIDDKSEYRKETLFIATE